MKKILLAGLVLGLTMQLMSGIASATLIYGKLWAPADAAAEDPSSPPLGDPTATFTVEIINFDSRIFGNAYPTSYDEFLAGGLGGESGTNPNGLIWNTWDSLSTYDKDDFYTSGGLGTFFQFTGLGYFEANSLVTHDDGFYLTLGITNYDYSNPVNVKNTVLSNAAGNYEFTLNYGAWNGYPEVLITRISDPVPEPATMLLFGAGIASLAGIRLRRKK